MILTVTIPNKAGSSWRTELSEALNSTTGRGRVDHITVHPILFALPHIINIVWEIGSVL